MVKQLFKDAPGAHIVGFDNVNDYYDVSLKRARDARLREDPNFRSYEFDICDIETLRQVFADEQGIPIFARWYREYYGL